MSEFQPNPALINKELADRSHNGTSWDPETRARQEIEGFGAEVQAVYDEVSRYAKTEAQKAILIQEMARFQAGYAEKYNAKLAAHGRCISTFITGTSNFPTSSAQKANNSYENRVSEMLEFKQRATSAIIRELKKLAIDEAGGELEVMKQKIRDAEKLQEDMKQANKHTATSFPGFALQNNGANIRRMKERLIELETKEATPSSTLTFVGGRIVDNAEADRVQIFHDEKPTQEIISKLKAEGWRWSPAGMCWQRKRTTAATISAKRITGAVHERKRNN